MKWWEEAVAKRPERALYQVRVLRHGNEVAAYKVRSTSITVGRGESCDIVCARSNVSREHVQLEITEDGTLLVRDLNSVNGTFVGDQRIEERRFRSAFVLRLGAEFELAIDFDTEAPDMGDETEPPIDVDTEAPGTGDETEPPEEGELKDDIQARVDDYCRLLQGRLDLEREEDKYFCNGTWLSRDAVLLKEKERKRAPWSLFLDLILVDCLLALIILGVYGLIVTFLMPR